MQITLFAYAIMVEFAWLLLHFLNINKQVESVADLENKNLEKQLMMVTVVEV